MAMEVNAQKIKPVATSFAIAGRSSRACDVCGGDQAHWFCSADEAYLCGKCDKSIHGANALASRHERSPLGPAGLPCMKQSSASATVAIFSSKSHGSTKRKAAELCVSTVLGARLRKKRRSLRPHPHAAATATVSVVSSERAVGKDQTVVNALVKDEPFSPTTSSTLLPCDEISASTIEFFRNEAAHEVPIFVPSPHDSLLPFDCDFTFSLDETSLSASHADAAVGAKAETLQQAECDPHFDLNCFLNSKVELRAMKEELDIEAAAMDAFTVIDELGLFTLCGEQIANKELYGLDFSSMGLTFVESAEASKGLDAAGDTCSEAANDSVNDDLCWNVKEEKVDDLNETEKLKLEVDELLACALVTGLKEEEEDEKKAAKTKISLKLDYDDVIMAWSDRGSLWTEGSRPQFVSEECEYVDYSRCSFGAGIVPDISLCCSNAAPGLEPVGLVPVANVCEDNGGREARVMRYREKRRTRLFSKKIRYEVRKLNAEMRPRWKGRFVKRAPEVS